MVGINHHYAASLLANPIMTWDVSAIALHLLGASIPKYFDGKVPTWVPGDPKYTDAIQYSDSIPKDYTSEEAEAITDRLRGLGYID
jgi:hypothetical protein